MNGRFGAIFDIDIGGMPEEDTTRADSVNGLFGVVFTFDIDGEAENVTWAAAVVASGRFQAVFVFDIGGNGKAEDEEDAA